VTVSTTDRTTDGPIVLKLGGSVVTDKGDPETVDDDSLDRAADAIAAHLADGTPTPGPEKGDDPVGLVLVHGGGSFGHHHASEHGVSVTAGTHDALAARAIHDAMGELNDRVLDSFDERGVPALPIHPLSAGARDEGGGLELSTTAVSRLLAEGFVPVVQADVIAHAGAGVTIVSGDELVVRLANDLDAARVGLCTTVPGVLDDEGEVIDRIESLEAAGKYLGGSEATDVTGGMYGKVEQLLALDAPASVFGLGSLEAFLAGDSPGTVVRNRST